MGEQGPTDLLVEIGPDGVPQKVMVAIPSGFPRLDNIARSYVLANWRWQSPPLLCLAKVTINWNILGGAEPNVPKPPAMSIPWEAGLSTSGGATFDIDVATPPGTNGMDPPLSLHYDSQVAGQSFIGPGWESFGLPSIARCPLRPDAFCATGNSDRLVAIKGGYGMEGTEYRANVQAFTRTISHGSANGEPEWFEISNIDGLTYEMGARPIPAKPIQPRARFALGASIQSQTPSAPIIQYNGREFTTGFLYPSRINYSGSGKAKLLPYNSVRFAYTTKPSLQLRHIQAFVEDRLVTDYRLDYGSSGAGSNFLKTLARCDGEGECLAPITFYWRAFLQKGDAIRLPTILDDGVGKRAFFSTAGTETRGRTAGRLSGIGCLSLGLDRQQRQASRILLSARRRTYLLRRWPVGWLCHRYAGGR